MTKIITMDLLPNRYIQAVNVPPGYELKIVDHGSTLVVKPDIKFKGKRPEYVQGVGYSWSFKGYHLERE